MRCSKDFDEATTISGLIGFQTVLISGIFKRHSGFWWGGTLTLLYYFECSLPPPEYWDARSSLHLVSKVSQDLIFTFQFPSIELLDLAHWWCPIQIWQLWLPFYPRPNISDRFFNLAPHFIHIQIFVIDFEETKWTFLNFLQPLSCSWNFCPTTKEGKRDDLNSFFL